MKTNSAAIVILATTLLFGLAACSKYDYDYKALGFSSNAEMEEAFSKGYHNKKKLTEMTRSAATAKGAEPKSAPHQASNTVPPQTTAPNNNNPNEHEETILIRSVQEEKDSSVSLTADRIDHNANNVTFSIVGDESKKIGELVIRSIGKKIRVNYYSIARCENCITKAELIDEAKDISSTPIAVASPTAPTPPAPHKAPVQPPTTSSTAAPTSSSTACTNITDCYQATLLAMSKNDITTVRRIAELIDAFQKPARGNRTVARKLNEEGLIAFRKNDFSQASSIWAKAQREDPSDVEIASNLGFARVKAADYTAANEALMAALVLNPRRTSTWIPIAEMIARRNQNTSDAVSALLVAYEWSTAREKAIEYYTAQSQTETNSQLKSAFEEALKRIPR